VSLEDKNVKRGERPIPQEPDRQAIFQPADLGSIPPAAVRYLTRAIRPGAAIPQRVIRL
jgi:hypothetical protein